MFRSLCYSLHAEGADYVCNTLVPETGPPFWKPFLLPAILRPRFWGRFLAPFLGPRKSKQELLDGPDGPDFVHLLAPAFLLQCKLPWTHTCSETSYRIVDVECIGRAKNTPVKPNRRNEKYKYIYGTMVATSCDLNAPRCATTVPQVRFHGSRGGVFIGHRPPRDPGDPLL